ncbi:MAG: RagB/SusD family nutrient uptake outer membrane protein [Prolixibacteraceae bacterium]|nr:RagB/SusD family nutrient uptake outer membrane protein [Prolixibacteraceae bacterium]
MKYLQIACLFAGILFTSCNEDFLDRTPLDFASPDNYLETEGQVESMVNGVYNQLDFGGTTSTYQRVYPFYLDCASDNVVNLSPWEGATDFARGQVTSTNFRVAYQWTRNYQGIARANVFLTAMAENTKLKSDKIARYNAEVKFLRAWFYADLITWFGDVPLLLVPGDLENGQPARTPKAQVLAQVLKDLDEAIPHLPDSYSDAKDNGRITKGAGLAFKARVLLYNSKWAEAAAAAKACMDLKKYSLFGNYEGLFLEANEATVSKTEAILEVFYTPQTNASFFQRPLMEWAPSYLPTLQLAESYYMANGLPITDPASGYDPENPYMNRDPRLAASIYYPGAPWTIVFWNKINLKFEDNWMMRYSGFKVKKWVNNGQAMDRSSGEGTNKLFIRYAEVLLTYAEAQNEASGPDASVYAAIDQLRTRCGMATLTAAMPSLTKEQMREVIRNERRVELVFEGLRFPDIQRWRIGEKVMVDAMGYDSKFLKDFSYPGDFNGTSDVWKYVPKVIDKRSFNPARDYLWPIPQNEMNSNVNMVQNPGYN